MAKTAESLAKIPEKCKSKLFVYSTFYKQALDEENEPRKLEYRNALRGYLSCLLDMGIIEHTDFGNIVRWVLSGHKID